MILKPRTSPHRSRILRVHSPVSRRGRLSYEHFRDCLRWEFGFTCAICLLHEVHLVLPGTGAESSGQMTIEHIVVKGTASGRLLKDEYTNCLLVCRFCNVARGHHYTHERTDGTRLLNPVADVWADHFELGEDRIEPRCGDVSAGYTSTAYGINDVRRVARRQKLRELIDARFENIRSRRLELEIIDQRLRGGEEPQWLLTHRGRVCEFIRRELDALRDLSGIPEDAPRACRCAAPGLTVATVISEGWQELPDDPLPDPPVPSKRRFRA